jgi:hypothetical protein
MSVQELEKIFNEKIEQEVRIEPKDCPKNTGKP